MNEKIIHKELSFAIMDAKRQITGTLETAVKHSSEASNAQLLLMALCGCYHL